MKWTTLYIKAPNWNHHVTPKTMKSVDDTISQLGAMLKCPPPSGMPVQEPDGTWEVRVYNQPILFVVRNVITGQFGMEIVKEVADCSDEEPSNIRTNRNGDKITCNMPTQNIRCLVCLNKGECLIQDDKVIEQQKGKKPEVREDDDELINCITNNDCGYKPDDIINIQAMCEGEYEEFDWYWIVKLKSGQFALTWGGCEFNGDWDCQSWGESVFATTARKAAMLAPEIKGRSLWPKRKIRECLLAQLKGKLEFGSNSWLIEDDQQAQ